MANWYPDEGLAQLDKEWKKAHPGAVVYHLGDDLHSTDPDVSQHARDRGGSEPGDDKGEVDASDFMPGKGGVTDKDLDDLAENLRKSRDPRILIIIRRQRICSSYPVGGVPAWTWRTYKGKYHGHTHVSVNDKYDANTADWKWENAVPREIAYTEGNVKFPELIAGDDDDNLDGYNMVVRMQALANLLDNSVPNLGLDGVYGGKSAQKLQKIFKAKAPISKVTAAHWRVLTGFGG